VSFDSFLQSLDPDREQAGLRYEILRRRLIKVFTCRGCSCPEELADQTLDRVIAKWKELSPQYHGDPGRYCGGVARRVYREYMRRGPALATIPVVQPDSAREIDHDHMERCLAETSPEQRLLLIEYYCCSGKAGTRKRSELAQRLGIGLNALRIRVHRIRKKIVTDYHVPIVRECTRTW